MEHLYDKLKQYAASDYYPYHMPGHKRRIYGEMPEQVMQMDITEIEGFDNLHQAEEILLTLQQKAAALYGSEESFYLVNGSTSGILSAVSAAVPEGGHILMARNCHKSAYHAAYLRNLTISYLYPEVLGEYDINGVITPSQVYDALKSQPNIKAVLLVSPTYEGRIASIGEIAKVVHDRGIPLIVDEAHGAHLGWREELGKNSCRSGADLVIHSLHKTLPSMTQTALLHVNGSLIDRDRLKRFLHIYQSSSPSYVLMASIDNALTIMEKSGDTLFEQFERQYESMLEQLSACRCLKFLPWQRGEQDIGKLVISTKKFGLSGQTLYDILLEKYHLQLEMAAGTYCLAMFTVSDGEEAYRRMTDALLDIDGQMQDGSLTPDLPKTDSAVIKGNDSAESAAIPLSKAWDMPGESIPLQEAVGKAVGEFVNLYPPGIPLLVPGEVLTGEKCDQILAYEKQHLKVQGVETVDGITHIKIIRV